MGSAMLKLCLGLCALLFLAVPDANATFDVNFLVATCARDTTGLPARTVRTPNGVGVTFAGSAVGDVILLCQINVEPGSGFLELRLVAQDNTPGGSATATLFRQEVRDFFGSEDSAPPEALVSVTTSDQPGVQNADTIDPDLLNGLDEFRFVFWIEVRLHRTSPTALIIVYNVALDDAF